MSDLSRFLGRCTFPPAGSSVVCGLSGGADSTALVALAVTAGCSVSAVHVHHGLRSPNAM
jgi:tRNA(Ile)-lysidine synthase